LALASAVQEINKKRDLLYNKTLELHIDNVGFSEEYPLKNPFIWLSGQEEMTHNYTCMTDIKSFTVFTGTFGTSA
jgi:hypothetical protein